MSCDGQLTAGGTVWGVCSGGNFTGNFSWGMSVGILWGNVRGSFWEFSGGGGEKVIFFYGGMSGKELSRVLVPILMQDYKPLHPAVMMWRDIQDNTQTS